MKMLKKMYFEKEYYINHLNKKKKKLKSNILEFEIYTNEDFFNMFFTILRMIKKDVDIDIYSAGQVFWSA